MMYRDDVAQALEDARGLRAQPRVAIVARAVEEQANIAPFSARLRVKRLGSVRAEERDAALSRVPLRERFGRRRAFKCLSTRRPWRP